MIQVVGLLIMGGLLELHAEIGIDMMSKCDSSVIRTVVKSRINNWTLFQGSLDSTDMGANSSQGKTELAE